MQAEQGLAHQMVYGTGSTQTIKHYYSGTTSNKKRKKGIKPYRIRKKTI